MSEKSNLPEFPDRETLLEYVRGGLTPFKRHQIEKLMLEHEFLRHAVEGLESEDPESLEEDLAELSDTIRVRSGMITRPGFNIYQLAATVSLIIMASVIIYVLVDWITQSDWEKRLSLNQTVQTESADSLMDQKSPETEQGGNVEGEVGQLQDRKDEQKPGKISVEEIGQAVLNKPPVSLEKPVEKSEDQLTNQPVRSQAESLPGREEEPSRPFITQPIPEKQELIEEYTATEREEGKHARDKDVPSAVAASEVEVANPRKARSEESAPSMESQPLPGIEMYRKYLEDSLRYPAEALKNMVEGVVLVNFTVGKDSIPENITLKQSIGYGCDEEAIRLILQGPRWKPVVIDGKVMESAVEVPIRFKIP
jgi:TonB family protein